MKTILSIIASCIFLFTTHLSANNKPNTKILDRQHTKAPRHHKWTQLASGIDYLDLKDRSLPPWSHQHVFRIDLKKHRPSLVFARDFSKSAAIIQDFAQYSQALIAINGGFFDENYQPLGLRYVNKVLHSPLKAISWWGVFYIEGKKPHISSSQAFRKFNPLKKASLTMAIQSGPRLIIDGIIPSLKGGIADRTALGITHDHKLIIVVSEHNPLSTMQLAAILKAPPLNCYQALNLDGGHSSQLFAKIHKVQIHVYGLSPVSDAFIIQSRKKIPKNLSTA